jgi:hypothetical protein
MGTEHRPGLYWWVRAIDETGMSGSGRVGQVVVFEDGSAALRWLKDRNSAGVQSTVLYESVRDLLWVHGHGEKKTGFLVPYFRVGETAFVNCIDGFGGPARVIAERDESTSHYQVQMWDKNPAAPFWAHDFELTR